MHIDPIFCLIISFRLGIEIYGTNGFIWGEKDFQTETWEKRSIPMSTSPQKLLKSVKLVFGGLYVGDV